MQVDVVSFEKNELDVQVDNVTIAEILRIYLSENGADFVAWKREHPSKPVVMKVKASNVSKAVADAVALIKKDCSVLVNELKK